MREYIRSFREMDPFVRYAGRNPFPPHYLSPVRAAYDHRLIYTLSGSAVLQMENHDVELHTGDVALIHSGIPYSFLTTIGAVCFFIVNFDFFSDHETDAPMPMPMPAPDAYQPELQHERIRFTEGFWSGGFLAETGMFDLLPYLETMGNEYNRAELMYSRRLRALMTVCLISLYRCGSRTVPQHGRTGHSDILAYISHHFAEPLTNRSIADRFHYHPNYVNQLVRTQTGRSLHQYLLRLRMLRATDLLLSGDMPIGEIARQTGFPDPNYFAQYFRRCYGCSPSAFRGGTVRNEDPFMPIDM